MVSRNSISTSFSPALAKGGFATTTTSRPGGRCECNCRKTSRRIRFARFRSTALPIRRVAMMPNRLGPPLPVTKWRENRRLLRLLPFFRTWENSWGRRIRISGRNLCGAISSSGRGKARLFGSRFSCGSNEAFSALGPPALQYTLSPDGLHSAAETMCLQALPAIWLIGSFHDAPPLR